MRNLPLAIFATIFAILLGEGVPGDISIFSLLSGQEFVAWPKDNPDRLDVDLPPYENIARVFKAKIPQFSSSTTSQKSE